jgi:hypothetical protein
VSAALAATRTATTLSARPAGRDRHDQPLALRQYVVDREPEDWGDGRSRIFAENRSYRTPRGAFHFTPVVVLTASITPTVVSA